MFSLSCLFIENFKMNFIFEIIKSNVFVSYLFQCLENYISGDGKEIPN